MAYKKPQIIAKSEAKQNYVAGCPTNKPSYVNNCGHFNVNCQIASVQ